MTAADPDASSTHTQRARAALDASIERTARGGAVVGVGMAALLAVAQLVFRARLLALVGTESGVLSGLCWSLVQTAFFAAVVWFAMRPAIRFVYRSLLEEGVAVCARVLGEPRPIHEAFGRISSGPGFVRAVIALFVVVSERWLPTRAVAFTFELAGERHESFALMYPDEAPTGPDEDTGVALVDPARPKRFAWLVRAPR